MVGVAALAVVASAAPVTTATFTGVDSGDTVSVTYDGGLRRPLKLTATEAMTLAVALRTLTDVPGATQGGAAERALAKSETAAGQHLDTTAVDIRLAAQDKWLSLAQRSVSRERDRYHRR